MMLARRSSRLARLVLTCAVSAIGLARVAGQVPPAPSCRTYSADEMRTLSGASSGTINQTCHFDAATYERLCTIRSRTSASSFTLNLTDTYTSVADFVDEIRVIPPIARIQRQTRRFTNGPAANADVTYEYDSARRQTRLSTAVNRNLSVMTYNSWDAMGRPTSGVSSSRASTVSLKYTYDDAARTMTITGPAGVEVDTYDGGGNMIHETSTDGGGKTEVAVQIVKTEMVCR
jgi:hypothetical protein